MGKNPGRQDKGPNQKKEMEMDWPYAKKTTQQRN